MAIAEPGFDADVILHEFAHSITRYINLTTFEPSWQKLATTASAPIIACSTGRLPRYETAPQIDEGVAFYFGCTLSGDSQWGDFHVCGLG